MASYSREKKQATPNWWPAISDWDRMVAYQLIGWQENQPTLMPQPPRHVRWRRRRGAAAAAGCLRKWGANERGKVSYVGRYPWKGEGREGGREEVDSRERKAKRQTDRQPQTDRCKKRRSLTRAHHPCPSMSLCRQAQGYTTYLGIYESTHFVHISTVWRCWIHVHCIFIEHHGHW